MESAQRNEQQYPSVEFAYDLITSSYSQLSNRFEAANSRIQNLLTWGIAIMAAIPVFAKAMVESVDFASAWFKGIIFVFLAFIVVGIIGHRAKGIKLISPQVLHDRLIQYSPLEFKRTLLYWAGQHFEINKTAIEVKSRYIDVMTILLVIGAGLGIAWVATVII